ncbi:saccharopine dehydrogenase family protein [Nonomuraea sp. NPDC002799]
MTQRKTTVAVYGAYGHTARFVIAELTRRGFGLILSGRDEERLLALDHLGVPIRPASADDPESLDRALSGAAAVINCAGPFAQTALPVLDAAVRAGAHYLDVSAEQVVSLAIFERAADVSTVVVPSMAFFGGLGDLLATSAAGDWTDADAVEIGIALDSWHPTEGTRRTGKINAPKHLIYTGGTFVSPPQPPEIRIWEFPPPSGTLEVSELATADSVAISRHLSTPEIRVYMNRQPLRDVRDPGSPAPVAADGSGRSSQTFLVDAVVRRGGEQRRATASGRDIYAVTAPLVVEATARILDGRITRTGAAAPGELFDAPDFLRALAPAPLTLGRAEATARL